MKKINENNIKELRGGLPQEKIARGAGISLNAYNNIEKGFSNPRIDTVYKIAAALERNVSEIEFTFNEGE